MPDSAKRFLTSVLKNKVRVLWAATILLGIYFTCHVIRSADQFSHGFATYYTASRLLIDGKQVGQFYNDEYFSINVKRFVPGVYEIYLVNLPTTSLLLVPLASFDYQTARIIWTIFNFVIFSLTILFLLRKFQFRQFWVPLTIILFLSFQPLYANFSYGQAYVLIFYLLAVAWHAYASDKYLLLGLTIGLMVIIKSAGILLLLLLLVQKKWKGLSWASAAIIFLVLITLPFLGSDSWIIYLQRLMDYSSAPELSVTAYQTIHSFFHHFTVFNQKWNPEPLFDLPVLGNMLSISAALALIIVSVVYSFRVKRTELSFGVFVIAGIILSPVSLDYHYLILMIPVLILITFLRSTGSKLIWFAFAFIFVLIAAPFPYTSSKFTGGWLALLAYPKLYGAVGILGIYLLVYFKPGIFAGSAKNV